MARGRLLDKDISYSGRFHRMGERARLVWLMCLPHTDKEGRIPGDPSEIQARCLPMAGFLLSDVEKYVEEILKAGMWSRYKDDRGRKVIVYNRFHDYQEKGQIQREKASKWSDPSQGSWDVHPPGGESGNYMQLHVNSCNSMEMPAESNLMESNGREGNSSARAREEPPPVFGENAKAQEAYYRTPEILATWQRVHARGSEYELTALDRWAIKNFIRPLSSLKDLQGFLSRAYAECRERGKESLADALDKLNSAATVEGRNGNGAHPKQDETQIAKNKAELEAYFAKFGGG